MDWPSTLRSAALLATGLLVSGCVAALGPAGATGAARSAGTSDSTAAASAPVLAASPSNAPSNLKRSSLVIPDGAVFSPDGRYFDYPVRGTLVIAPTDGASPTHSAGVHGRWSWLSDSSGLLVETSAPQRAGPLAILELDGTLTALPLQFADPLLSADGKTVVAAVQEGCCMDIVQREIRAAPRNGGAARVLVTSSAPASTTQPVALLGIATPDRVLFRDGDRIGLAPLAGGRAEPLAIPPGLVPSRLFADSASPDRSVILLQSTDPTAAWLFRQGRISGFPSEAGTIVRISPSSKAGVAAPVWIGPRTLLVRAHGSLASYDLGASTPGYGSNALRTLIPEFAGGTVLAYRAGALLWRNGDRVHLLTLATGRDRDTGLALTTASAIAVGIPGGFLVAADSASFEIAEP